MAAHQHVAKEQGWANPSTPINAAALRHPVLVGLADVKYGRLRVVTPDKEMFLFVGPRKGPQADLYIHHWHAMDAVVSKGEIGFAEGYIQNVWDTNDLTALITFILKNGMVLEKFFYGRPWYKWWGQVRARFHPNSIPSSKRAMMAHYDLGNAFYTLWLDKSMTYSGALFEGNEHRTLEDAQAAKHHRMLAKLGVEKGAHILDIGCGWGAFMEHAAKLGHRVTGVTLSKSQRDYARARMDASYIDYLTSVQLGDYRKIGGTYDHVASAGVMEHVGEQNWPSYFKTIADRLKSGGTAMVQTITLDERVSETAGNRSSFIEQYIFPGSKLPTKDKLRELASEAGLEFQEMYAFGRDYALTMSHWLKRFEAAGNKIIALGYNDTLLRMWRFYLASCIASFNTRRTDVVQMLLRKR